MATFKKLIFPLALAFLAAGLTLGIVEAQGEPVDVDVQSQNCGSCHEDIQVAWYAGAHGNVLQDSLFKQAWTEQKQPGACLVCHVTGYDPASGTWKQDGVSCEACHTPITVNHPQEPMPVKDPDELCAHCHSDVRFGWEEWQSSTHYQRSMSCTTCHDPHSASLKVIQGAETEGPSALCINCHREYSMNFPYSTHKQAGVNCIDCHLQHYGEPADRDIHTMPDHSFAASLTTCNSCHANQMHTGSASESNPSSAPVAPLEDGQLATEPSPVSPYGYAGLAGLLGLAGGMILSPWLDKAYRHLTEERMKK